MNPSYKFELSADGVIRTAKPNYKDDIAIQHALEQGQQFYRSRLSGQLVFQGEDFDFIVDKAFDTQFQIDIAISYDGGETWTGYWEGTFWKTDCEFNLDDRTASVTPQVSDIYVSVLNGIEKEFDLIKLVPEIAQIRADKRPLVQVYIPGQSVIGCFLSGMWWEQDCEVVNEGDRVEIGGVSYPALTHKYFFAKNKTLAYLQMSGGAVPQVPASVTHVETPGIVGVSKYFDFVDGDYRYARIPVGGGGSDRVAIYSVQTGMAMWLGTCDASANEVVLHPEGGQGASGDIRMVMNTLGVYARFLCDTPNIVGLSTNPLPADDIVPQNRNYHRAIGYNFPGCIYFGCGLTTTTPTEWGLYQPGVYYQRPEGFLLPEMYPVARNAWNEVSVWFAFSEIDTIVEESGRQPFMIRHAYPLWSVLSVLLKQISPDVSFEGTEDYSQFFYGDNPIFGGQEIYILPKSNLVNAGYDQPAQKAPIRLRDILDMLRDCYRCYWFIDSEDRFRVEHIEYFRRGGTYDGSPVIGIDLTAEIAKRNGKPWAFGQDKYTYEKPAMAGRYQFSWMDDVTQLFEGYPIEIISDYVEAGNIEQISVSNFTSDIDYILLNPSAVSSDGFMLLSAAKANILSMPIEVQTRQSDGYAKLLDYPQGYGSTAVTMVEVSDGYADYAFYDSSNNLVSLGRRFYAGQVERIIIEVPPAAAYVGVISSIPGATVTLTSVVPDVPAVIYLDLQDAEGSHVLQNAPASFAWLQRLYAYDMPGSEYEIHGERYTAFGVKKLMVQSVNFPVLVEPDLTHLIKTNLGNGVIDKMSVSLLSRFAKAELRHDTEQL